MSRLIYTTLLVLASSVLIASELTPEELATRKQRVRDLMEKKYGGRIRKANASKQSVYVVSAIGTKHREAMARMIDEFSAPLRIEVKVKEGATVDLKSANEAKQKIKDAGAVLFVVEGDKTTPAILNAFDERWCILNAATFIDDEDRFSKEFFRAMTQVCGGGAFGKAETVLCGIDSPEDLDKIEKIFLPMDLAIIMGTYLKSIGVTPYREATYLKACQEGWAPEPTNEYQKAIWEQVHAIPQKPIKIEFDPKTDTK